MASLDTIVTGLGPVKRHVRLAAEEIVRACPYPIYFWWGAPGRGTGDHAKGLAVDIMNYSLGGGVNSPGPERREVQNFVKGYALKHRVRLGLTYVIADRQIASDESDPDWSWRRYTRSDPHTNHVHMSFKAEHTYHPPTEEEDIVASLDDLREVIQEELLAVWDRKFLEYVDNDGNAVRDPRTVADTLYLTQMEVHQLKAAVAALTAKVEQG